MIMMKRALPLLTLALAMASTNVSTRAQSAGDQALLDALVRKGVLTNKEAEDISAEVAKDALNNSPQNKIKVGDWVQELKLSGDLRIRNQWDERDPMLIDKSSKTADPHIQRDRWRFRLRLFIDFKLQDNFFGGVMLSTSDNRASDTKNATFTGGYDNYNIYIARAFMGWNPVPGATFIVGKQANPFYTTDLLYDTDVEPTGLVERIDFHKFFNLSFGEPTAGYSKEGKAVAPPPTPAAGNGLELSLIAGQFIFEDNAEDSQNTQLKWDAYQFQTQLLAKLNFGKNLTLTWAPGVFVTNDAAVGATAVTSKGVLIPPPTGTLNNSQPFPITQRDLLVLLSPGDITYRIAGKPLSVYWDFAYNLEGNDRFNREYGPLFADYTFVNGDPVFSNRVKPSFSDNLAWLVGIRYGENKKAGDFSLSLDYRQQGISSIDPNINNSNFHFSNLNSEGFEFNVAYNFTDFFTFALTGYISDALTKNLYGGFATQGTYPIARDRHDKVIQANVIMKF
jgi:hypothetical protein